VLWRGGAKKKHREGGGLVVSEVRWSTEFSLVHNVCTRLCPILAQEVGGGGKEDKKEVVDYRLRTMAQSCLPERASVPPRHISFSPTPTKIPCELPSEEEGRMSKRRFQSLEKKGMGQPRAIR